MTWSDLTHYSRVPIIDFEQINAGWGRSFVYQSLTHSPSFHLVFK